MLSEPKPRTMTTKKSTSKKQTPKPVSVPVSEISPFGHTFVLKDATLVPEPALAEDAELLALPHLPQEEAQVIVLALIYLFGVGPYFFSFVIFSTSSIL